MKKIISSVVRGTKKNPVAVIFGLSLCFAIVALFIGAYHRDTYGTPSQVLMSCVRWSIAVVVISGTILMARKNK